MPRYNTSIPCSYRDVQKIFQQNAQIATLKTALRTFIDANTDDIKDAVKEEFEEAVDEAIDYENEREEIISVDDINIAIWDSFDNVYRCTECAFEVVEGVCWNSNCGMSFDWESVNIRRLSYVNSLN